MNKWFCSSSRKSLPRLLWRFDSEQMILMVPKKYRYKVQCCRRSTKLRWLKGWLVLEDWWIAGWVHHSNRPRLMLPRLLRDDRNPTKRKQTACCWLSISSFLFSSSSNSSDQASKPDEWETPQMSRVVIASPISSPIYFRRGAPPVITEFSNRWSLLPSARRLGEACALGLRDVPDCPQGWCTSKRCERWILMYSWRGCKYISCRRALVWRFSETTKCQWLITVTQKSWFLGD